MLVRLPVVVRRVAPGVTGLVLAGRVPSSVALGAVVVPGAYTVPGVVPTGVVPAGVVKPPFRVPPFRVLLGTVPLVVPTWPGATVPGAVVAPGVPGTVWAKAVVLKPSPSRAAKANAVVFIREVRIS